MDLLLSPWCRKTGPNYVSTSSSSSFRFRQTWWLQLNHGAVHSRTLDVLWRTKGGSEQQKDLQSIPVVPAAFRSNPGPSGSGPETALSWFYKIFFFPLDFTFLWHFNCCVLKTRFSLFCAEFCCRWSIFLSFRSSSCWAGLHLQLEPDGSCKCSAGRSEESTGRKRQLPGSEPEQLSRFRSDDGLPSAAHAQTLQSQNLPDPVQHKDLLWQNPKMLFPA